MPHILKQLKGVGCCAAEEDFVDPDTGNTLNSTAICLFWLNEADIVEAARISAIQSTLNNRLSVAASVGDSALASAVTAIQTTTPEVAAVILADTGADPVKYPYLVWRRCTWCNGKQHAVDAVRFSCIRGIRSSGSMR